MWRPILIALVIAGFLGCSACRDLRRAGSLEVYTAELVVASGADLAAGDCALPGGVHGGFCLVSGDQREILALVDHLGLIEPAEDGPARTPCKAFTAFGGGDRDRGVQLESISRFTAPEAIPTTLENVHLVAIYAGSYAACLEFE